MRQSLKFVALGLIGAVVAGLAFVELAKANEPPLVKLLNTVCVNHPFDRPGAEAEIAAAGFVVGSSPFAEETRAVFGKDSQVFEGMFEGKDAMIVLSTSEVSPNRKRGLPMADSSGCMIVVIGGDRTGTAAVRDWADVPLLRGGGDGTLHLFRDEAGRHTVLSETQWALIKAALDAGTWRQLMVMDDGRASTVMLESRRTAKP